jgi:hypothetical protein
MLDPERGVRDPVQTSIGNLRNSTLFVMAAGNYGTDLSHICDVRPTCFDMPNVIVVAGLDRQPDTPGLYYSSNGRLLTNYGTRVHIGAIGESVFSTIAFGRYGIMSGSSFAAPQVAAVASLVMRKYRRLTPQEVKNRLIYCSDHVDALEDKLFGGRLNAACALDGDAATLTLTTFAAGAVPLRGYFQAGLTMKFRNRETSRITAIPIENVRGVHFNASQQCYTVYFDAEKTSDSPLLRETNLVPEPTDAALTFIASAAGPKTIHVNEIVRYTSGVK